MQRPRKIGRMSSAKLTFAPAAHAGSVALATPRPIAPAVASAAVSPISRLAFLVIGASLILPRPASARARQSSLAPPKPLLRELELQGADLIRVPHLRVVERCDAKLIAAVELVELHVGLAARHQLACHDGRPLAVLPLDRGGDVAAVTGERRQQDRRNFVARLELGIVKRNLLFLPEIVRSARLVRRRAALVHELGLAVDQFDVVVAAAGLGIALAPGLGSLVLVVARVVDVLVVRLADVAGADRLQVPDVTQLALGLRILVAKRLARLAGVAGRHAARTVETLDRTADVPDQSKLVLVELVVVAALVVRIGDLLPAAIRLLLIGAASHGFRRILVLHEHVERVGGINRFDARGGRSALEVRTAEEPNAQRFGLRPRRIGRAGGESRWLGRPESRDGVLR